MSVYLQDPDFTLHQGDALETLRELPDQSVHMVCTSPPFYGLRDYGTGSWEGGSDDCDHEPDRTSPSSTLEGGKMTQGMARVMPSPCIKCGARRVDQQIGLEETPDQYVARLVDVFREVRRVLRDDGTLWLEVGDSYNQPGSHTGRNDRDSLVAFDVRRGYLSAAETSVQKRPARGAPRQRIPNLKPKDLIGAPWLLAFALRADGWYLRSDIVWARPNPMPESVTDRPTKSHSYVFLLAKSARYFFDQEAVREPDAGLASGNGFAGRQGGARDTALDGGAGTDERFVPGSGRNVRSVWTIPTQPLADEHYAAFPERLAERCILAGTSERGVCPECGAPWQRIVETNQELLSGSRGVGRRGADHRDTREADFGPRTRRCDVTTGWHPTCACYGTDTDFRIPAPAVVLDPFIGSGTTALVARRHGRRTIGIELSPEYCAIAARRTQQQSLLA